MNAKKWVLISLAGTVLVLSVGFALTLRFVRMQGAAAVDWNKYTVARVVRDAQGIATVEGADWKALAEAQGFVTASDRLWQMDLMRRNASGRLSEWFGARATDFDEKRRREDWQGVADRAAEALPPDERETCEAYAKGVNQFITEHPRRWGIEYRMLKAEPVPWKCRDSIFVLMLMGEDLSSAVYDEAAQWSWRRHLPAAWQDFLFPQSHPWNQPTFGGNGSAIQLPGPMSPEPLVRAELDKIHTVEPIISGSNSWAWSGDSGAFLANDPHLGRTVPQLWYAIRLRASQKDWAVGASIPGLPGIVLGRNREIAWAFTNAKEDVDDLLVETLSSDEKKYLARREGGREEWREIEERPYTITVRDGKPREGVARFTHRGPLLTSPELGGGTFSRQWLVLHSEALRIPTVRLARARNWEEFNQAFDAMRVPAQSVLFMDRMGSTGIRVSGTGIERRTGGLVPTDALRGEWLGFKPASSRPRKLMKRSSGTPPLRLASANERLWRDKFGNHWSSDQRRERIDVMLDNEDPNRRTMETMQMDTYSRYHQLLAKWIGLNTTQKGPLVDRLQAWNGEADADPLLLSQLFAADRAWVSFVLSRIQKHFVPESVKVEGYRWKLENAWQVAVLENQKGMEIFGVTSSALADALMDRIEKGLAAKQDYRVDNRSTFQHPMADLPVVGWFFRIDRPLQSGWASFVRVDKPKFGAGTRLVWDMRARDGGSWIFPVGQSGHIGSDNYSDMQKLWVGDTRLGVLPAGFEWGEQAD